MNFQGNIFNFRSSEAISKRSLSTKLKHVAETHVFVEATILFYPELLDVVVSGPRRSKITDDYFGKTGIYACYYWRF